MRWPWVARSTLDAVVAERDRLVEMVDRLMAHRTALERKDAGLRDADRPPAEPMPRDVVQLIEQWEGGATRERLMQEAWTAYRVNRDWGAVRAMLEFPDG